MGIDEDIHISKHNLEWTMMYGCEKEQLCKCLGNLIVGIEHIGSTSIPGIYAKPIIDILIGVERMPINENDINNIISLGYEYLGEAGVTGRIYFRKRFPNEYNIHVTRIGSELWNNDIRLRDYLLKNKAEAERYSNLKQSIIAEGVNRLLEYSDRKSNFISELLQKINNYFIDL
jgi:GrpB-like predicted nucleotidyltransferase (UPF0157 family)